MFLRSLLPRGTTTTTRTATYIRGGRAAIAPSSLSLGSRGFRIRTYEDVVNDGGIKDGRAWQSRRYFLKKDGFGYSFHHTILYKDSSSLIHYKNHVELVFVFAGTGEIEVVTGDQKEGEGVVYKLGPGTMYALDKHDKHYLRAGPDEDMQVCCTFNPPLSGDEDHDENGVYPLN